MDERPFLIMIAGPNGSGKTKLFESLEAAGIELGEYVNADRIALTLEGTDDERAREAQTLAEGRRRSLMETKTSFTFETVMSHESKIAALSEAKRAGYFVRLFFVGTEDATLNVERVALRVALGGHDVPEDKIRARWRRSMSLLYRAILASDEARIFHNGALQSEAGGPLLVLCRTTAGDVRIQSGLDEEELPSWVGRFAMEPLMRNEATRNVAEPAK